MVFGILVIVVAQIVLYLSMGVLWIHLEGWEYMMPSLCSGRLQEAWDRIDPGSVYRDTSTR